MNFEFHLPLWAILYCGFLVANGATTIMISKDKSPIYILGETLSTLFAVSFFFMYFKVIPTPANVFVLLLMLFHIFYQEIWMNRKLYKQFVFDSIPERERQITLLVMGVIMTIFLLPFLYVVSDLIF